LIVRLATVRIVLSAAFAIVRVHAIAAWAAVRRGSEAGHIEARRGRSRTAEIIGRASGGIRDLKIRNEVGSIAGCLISWNSDHPRTPARLRLTGKLSNAQIDYISLLLVTHGVDPAPRRGEAPDRFAARLYEKVLAGGAGPELLGAFCAPEHDDWSTEFAYGSAALFRHRPIGVEVAGGLVRYYAARESRPSAPAEAYQ
jgi:hypothetical protein